LQKILTSGSSRNRNALKTFRNLKVS
jgi:hypothetical protein